MGHCLTKVAFYGKKNYTKTDKLFGRIKDEFGKSDPKGKFPDK